MGSLYHDNYSLNNNSEVTNKDVNKPANASNKSSNAIVQQKSPVNDQTKNGNVIPADPVMQVWPTTSFQLFFVMKGMLK